MGGQDKGGGILMAAPNIVISAVKITPQTVNVGEKFVISVTIVPEQFRIATKTGETLLEKSGNELICKEE